MSPEAIRKRKQRERQAPDPLAKGAYDHVQPIAAPAPPTAIPLHETQPITGPGPDAYLAIPVLPPAAEGGEPRPFVSGDAATVGADGQPIAAPSVITAEEAKAFALIVVQYFQFGSRALFDKNPEFATSLVGMSGSAEAFNRNFGVACSVIAGAAERVAMKYNLRIPYMDEVIVISAIGVASYGLAAKPEKDKKRAAAAKDANPKREPDDDKPDDDKKKAPDLGPFAEAM